MSETLEEHRDFHAALDDTTIGWCASATPHSFACDKHGLVVRDSVEKLKDWLGPIQPPREYRHSELKYGQFQNDIHRKAWPYCLEASVLAQFQALAAVDERYYPQIILRPSEHGTQLESAVAPYHEDRIPFQQHLDSFPVGYTVLLADNYLLGSDTSHNHIFGTELDAQAASEGGRVIPVTYRRYLNHEHEGYAWARDALVEYRLEGLLQWQRYADAPDRWKSRK